MLTPVAARQNKTDFPSIISENVTANQLRLNTNKPASGAGHVKTFLIITIN